VIGDDTRRLGGGTLDRQRLAVEADALAADDLLA
jgi:hypothetical protein